MHTDFNIREPAYYQETFPEWIYYEHLTRTKYLVINSNKSPNW